MEKIIAKIDVSCIFKECFSGSPHMFEINQLCKRSFTEYIEKCQNAYCSSNKATLALVIPDQFFNNDKIVID